jgi:hypothetical protein
MAAAAIEVRDASGGGEVPEPPARLEPAPKVKIAATPTRRGAKIRRFSVKAPRGATVHVTCKGPRCPGARTTKGARTAKRLRRFERSYRGGTRLEVRITKPDLVGADVKLRIRARHRDPVRSDACLWPGESKPRGCPAG